MTTFATDRIGLLGGSDMAALFGCGFIDHAELYRIKAEERRTGKAVERKATFRMDAGTALEEPILRHWAEKRGIQLCTPATHEHPLVLHDYPWATGNLDAWFYDTVGNLVVVDAKAPGLWSAQQWREGAPEKYRLQMLFYAHRFGAQRMLLIVDLGGPDPAEFEIGHDADTVGEMIERATSFDLALAIGEEWEMPGAVTEAPRFTAEGRVHSVEAVDSDLRDAIARWHAACDAADAAEAEKKEASDAVMALVPFDAARVMVDGTDALIVSSRSTESVDYKRLDADHPGLRDRYKKPAKVSVFPTRPRAKKGGSSHE